MPIIRNSRKESAECDTAAEDLENSRNEVQQMKNEKFLSGKGVKADDLDYVTYKVSKMVDDKTTFEKAKREVFKGESEICRWRFLPDCRFFNR